MNRPVAPALHLTPDLGLAAMLRWLGAEVECVSDVGPLDVLQVYLCLAEPALVALAKLRLDASETWAHPAFGRHVLALLEEGRRAQIWTAPAASA